MFNKKIGIVFAFLIVIASSAYGQESVLPLLPYDGTVATFVDEQFKADTAATGGLLADRVYELQRDAVYLTKAIINIQAGKTLRMRAAAGTGEKPIIYLWEQGTGNTPTRPPGNFVQLAGGNLELYNICIVGYYELEPERLDGVQGGLINTNAVGSSIIVDGVVFSNINGQHIRTGSNAVKVKVTNTIFANMGALTTSNLGAGKGLDLREATIDTFIVQNCTFVNFQDRAIRHYNFGNPLLGTGPIKYGLIDHNTFVNGMGYHGLLSLGNVGTDIHVTNNLFVDAFSLGEDSTDVTRIAEWANTGEKYPNGANRITWIFSAPNDTTQWRVANNYYTVSDSGQAFLDDFEFPLGAPLSWHINSKVQAQGGDTLTAFQEVALDLVNAPQLMNNMMRWYEDPTGGNKSKNTPGVVFDPATDDFDRRLITYYRDSLDASYATSSAAYTGAKGGYPVGDLNWFPDQKALWAADVTTGVSGSEAIPVEFTLNQNFPNPFNPSTTLTYGVPVEAQVTLEVFDVLGRKLAVLAEGKRLAGTYTVSFDASNFVSGVYFYRLTTPNSSITRKMMLLK
ncbi:MAG TPA: T9SS type A sorting domain-containing protein [Bacteroidota bacterium]